MTETACIDLFCGAGGLTHGLQAKGVNVVAGVDVDENCRHPFEVNNNAIFLLKDVQHLRSEELRTLFGSARFKILAGCAPCQPFSTYAQRYDTAGTPRWALLYHFGRLIRELEPDVVTMENVPTVAKHKVFSDFVNALEETGYVVHTEVVDCRAYGLPQNRRRMVLLASRFGKITIPPPSHETYVSVRDAIGHVVPVTDGEKDPKDPLHTSSKLSPINRQRIRASKPGGSWRDWPRELVAECHKRATGKTYPGVYGRMKWDEPAPTLTTQFFGFGNGRFGHPEQDRALSLREGAILQGFPTDYSFLPMGQKVHLKALGRMIGNAVPVTLGEVIGSAITAHLASIEAGASEQPVESSQGVESQTCIA
ncbi:DNA cytosine methyltransferase [Ciceribacter selenitireducens]|uniref:DNA cytosine methyltransferase n=1 Tax=Ciceribacter selenitireducens TaxID=448181 RepID=UPI000E204DDA|nr:DNA cytosine methyltransferase [Ciceribacter selenitireducens]